MSSQLAVRGSVPGATTREQLGVVPPAFLARVCSAGTGDRAPASGRSVKLGVDPADGLERRSPTDSDRESGGSESNVKQTKGAALIVAWALVAFGAGHGRESGADSLEQAPGVTLTRLVFGFTAQTRGSDAVHGSLMTYATSATNSRQDAMAADTIVITDAIPTGGVLLVQDIDAAGSGPVRFRQGSTPSGLTYSFLGLASSTDDLMFSADGGNTFDYAPTSGPRGTDPKVTHIKIHPKGAFAGRTELRPPSFQLEFRVLRAQE